MLWSPEWFCTRSPLPWARVLSLALQIAAFSANLLFLCFSLGLIRKRKKKKRQSNDGCSPGEWFVSPGPAADHLRGCIEHQENVPISVLLCFQFHRMLLFLHLRGLCKKEGQQAFGGEAREHLAHDDDTWKKKDFAQDDHGPLSLPPFLSLSQPFWTPLSPNCLLPVSSSCWEPRAPLSRESLAI